MPNLNPERRPVDNIFQGRQKAIAELFCIPPPAGCGKPLKEYNVGKNFRDELSFKEYLISGLCQECQDVIFADEEPTEDDIDPNYGDPF